MCGIAGIIDLRDRLPTEDRRIETMCATLAHRGPNDQGFAKFPMVHFGFRRLSIIDLSGGRQPLYNEAGTVCVIFNGEIYNFPELRADLERRGHVFGCSTDGAVIPHLYEEYGMDFVRMLNGMFAIAIYDANKRRVLLVRDRFGIKPLYYAQHNAELVFASEIKAILAGTDPGKQLNMNSVAEFLSWEYVPSPWTLFTDIYKLAPGSVLEVDMTRGSSTIYCWWTVAMTLREASKDGPQKEGEWLEAIDAALATAVRRQLVSDVPLGALLSGGVDSSLVAAAMPEFTAFTADFSDADYSELTWARRVAEHLGVRQIWEITQPEIMANFARLIEHLDDPLGDFSIFPTFLVCRLARKSVTVVLSGDGGDELFGGYETYKAQAIADRCRLVPSGIVNASRLTLGGWSQGLRKSAFTRRLARFLDGMAEPKDLGHARWRLRMQDEDRADLFAEEAAAEIRRNGGAHIREKFKAFSPLSEVNRQLCVDMETYLPDNCLAKVDRMSMACSVEARVPFLDNDLANLALRMPDQFKVRGTSTKYLLKKVAARHVPRDCVYRAKRGFTLPMAQWMRRDIRPMVEDLLSAERLRRRGVLEPTTVERLKSEHFSGRRDHAHLLWNLVVFEGWMGRWMDSSARCP
jgi:asparagine synthase (glutamine-hydrolysing)